MGSENTPLSTMDFAKKLLQKLGRGDLFYAKVHNITEVKISGFGSRYIYVIENPTFFSVGAESIRGFHRAAKDDSGVETAYAYIKHLEADGWFKDKPTGPSIDFAKRRAMIEKMIYDTINVMDPPADGKGDGDNTKRWKALLSNMSDKEFEKFIDHLRNKRCQLNIVMPNMKKTPKIPNLLQAAKMVGLKTSHRLWLPDRTRPGKKFLTNEKYLVLEIPIRRAQQEWDKKLQVPSRDSHVDALTGQVIMDDKACHLSTPEIQSLSTRGLNATLAELIRVRGGDVVAYGDFNRQLQEAGEAKLGSLDPRTRARSGVISHVLLESMMFENNL